MRNISQKLKLLERDLDTAEDQLGILADKKDSLEAQFEDLTRENKNLTQKLRLLDGKIKSHSYILLSILWQCTTKIGLYCTCFGSIGKNDSNCEIQLLAKMV